MKYFFFFFLSALIGLTANAQIAQVVLNSEGIADTISAWQTENIKSGSYLYLPVTKDDLGEYSVDTVESDKGKGYIIRYYANGQHVGAVGYGIASSDFNFPVTQNILDSLTASPTSTYETL